jgi:hypothetical protein
MFSNWRRPVMAAIVLSFFVAVPAVLLANHSWGNYHWARTSNPFTLKVGDNVSTAWDAYLNEAISDWSASSVLNLTKVTGGTRPKTCKATAGRIEACSERYGFNGWLGLASIWASGSHITQATTKVNDSYFNTSTYNTPAWRRLVMCQEIAHDFGLDHQDENFNNGNLGTCMDYTNDPDGPPSNEHPNAHDFAQLETIYAHLDSTTTVGSSAPTGPGRGAAPPAFNDLTPGDSPAQWGRLVAQSRDGGQSVYELDFGRGYKIITHVTWTMEMAAKNRAAMGHHD